MEDKRMVLRVEADLYEKIVQMAKETRRSITAQINVLLREALQKQKK